MADLENFGGGDFEAQNLKNSDVFTEIESDFSPKIRWSPKKKKKVFTEIKSDLSAEIVRLRMVGGDASRNGTELIEIEANFSAKIVTFRLVGGMHPPLGGARAPWAPPWLRLWSILPEWKSARYVSRGTRKQINEFLDTSSDWG